MPYLIHTNRELGLMLRGLKPLAKFVDGEGRYPDVVLRYLRMFDRQVVSGRLVRHDEFVTRREDRLHYIYFALPSEEWRIKAMVELMAEQCRWSPDMERREGELLGYTAEQNQIWLSRYYSGPD